MPPDSDTPEWLRDLVPESRHRVHVCFGKNCTPAGAKEVFAALQRAVAQAGLTGEIELLATSCRSRCELGPSVNVYPGPVPYGQMTPERAERVVRQHLIPGGRAIEEYIVSPEDLERARTVRRLPPG